MLQLEQILSLSLAQVRATPRLSKLRQEYGDRPTQATGMDRSCWCEYKKSTGSSVATHISGYAGGKGLYLLMQTG